MNTILSLIFSCLFLSGVANALELPSQYVDTPRRYKHIYPDCR